MDRNDLAEKLTAFRHQNGLSQRELGDMLSVSNKAVSKWENGESMPKTSTLIKIADIMKIDVSELLGAESSNAPSTVSENEVSALKSENEALKSQLSSINRRKNKIMLSAASVTVILIIVCSLLVHFFGGSDSSNKIPDAGSADTKVVFDSVTFYPLEQNGQGKNESSYEYYSSLLIDKKYADYYSRDGKKTRVIVRCNPDSDFIAVKSGKKLYLYSRNDFSQTVPGTAINEETTQKADSLSELNVKKYISHITLLPQSKSNLHKDTLNSERKIYYSTDRDGEEFIKAMFNFYENKGEPADSKITEVYLGNEAYTVVITINTDTTPSNNPDKPMGEFFKDGKGKVYFYSYLDVTSYPVGKEISKYVYNE